MDLELFHFIGHYFVQLLPWSIAASRAAVNPSFVLMVAVMVLLLPKVGTILFSNTRQSQLYNR